MKLTASNMLRIEAPTPELMEFIQKKYEMPNPEYLKKERMGFWTGNTPKKIALYQIDGWNGVLLPRGALKELLPFFSIDEITMDCSTRLPKIDYGPISMELYPYQQTAVENMVWSSDGILQAPAGSGKTQMGIAIIKELQLPALWITHTQDLLRQSYERAACYIPKQLLGTITEGKAKLGEGITFATVQTLSKMDLSQWKNRWGVIVVDECHRATGSPTQLTMFSKVLNSLNSRCRYGLSATVHRADGMIEATYALLGPVVYSVPEEAVTDRVLPVTVKPVYTDTPESYCYLDTDGMIKYPALTTYLCEDMERNRLIIDHIEDKPSLILSDRVSHLRLLYDMLPDDKRAVAAVIDGKMTSKAQKKEREQAIARMRSGELQYLFATYQLAKEGLDIPRLERLYLATPQHDYAVIVQSLGRIARTYPGKSNPIAYDFIDRRILYEWRQFKKRCTVYKKAKVSIDNG